MDFTLEARPIPPWIRQMMSADKVAQGGVVYRHKSSVAQQGGTLGELKRYCRSRGFHLIQTGDFYVVLCNQGDIRIHC